LLSSTGRTENGKKTWLNSKEKQMLKADIENDYVTDKMHPSMVYKMHNGAYKFDQKNFKNNLYRLRESIKASKKLAATEAGILTNSMQGKPDINCNRQTTWFFSDARRILIRDDKAGLLCGMTPKQIYDSNPVYQTFELKAFRDNLNKEKNRKESKGSGYWMNVKARR
jgi:hypothetical protein